MASSFVLHYIVDFVQIHIYWVSDAIQPSYPLPLSSFALLKAWIIWHSSFFIVQLLHLDMITEKNHSFDYMELWQQKLLAKWCLCFLLYCRGLS